LQLRLCLKRSLNLSIIKPILCDARSSSLRCHFSLSLLLGLILAANARAQVNPGSTPEAPPAIPPKSLAFGDWNFRYQTQDIVGHVYKLRGSPGAPAEIENSQMLFRADEIDFDQDSGDVRASGHITYNTDEETGKFYDVIGETRPRVVAKPGVLTTNNPFHFEGVWAERIGD